MNQIESDFQRSSNRRCAYDGGGWGMNRLVGVVGVVVGVMLMMQGTAEAACNWAAPSLYYNYLNVDGDFVVYMDPNGNDDNCGAGAGELYAVKTL